VGKSDWSSAIDATHRPTAPHPSAEAADFPHRLSVPGVYLSPRHVRTRWPSQLPGVDLSSPEGVTIAVANRTGSRLWAWPIVPSTTLAIVAIPTGPVGRVPGWVPHQSLMSGASSRRRRQSPWLSWTRVCDVPTQGRTRNPILRAALTRGLECAASRTDIDPGDRPNPTPAPARTLHSLPFRLARLPQQSLEDLRTEKPNSCLR
jgi:hypothetical protein